MQNEDDISAVTKLAEQGDADAQCSLGEMYDKGRGVAQDYAEAVKWYRMAAEQGYAWAQRNLGATCMKLGRLAEAESAYQEAMGALRPLGNEDAAAEAEAKWREVREMR